MLSRRFYTHQIKAPYIFKTSLVLFLVLSSFLVFFVGRAYATHQCAVAFVYDEVNEINTCSEPIPDAPAVNPTGVAANTAGRVVDCNAIDSYTVACTEILTNTFGDKSTTTWNDCAAGAVAISWSPFRCGPPTTSGTPPPPPATPPSSSCTTCGCAGYAPCASCTTCGCPGYPACTGPTSLTINVDCTSRTIFGVSSPVNAIIYVSYVPWQTWQGSGTSDGAGNYSISMASAPNSGRMDASLAGTNIVSTDYVCPPPTSPQPVGYADFCKLDKFKTLIYGWAYDPDDLANSDLPIVDLTVGTNTLNNLPTNADYRSGGISLYLDGLDYAGKPRGQKYGFVGEFNDLLSSYSPYDINGTIRNVGAGSDQQLGINTTDRPDFNALNATGTFAFNKLPDSCLPKPYRLTVTANKPTVNDDDINITADFTHVIKNLSAPLGSSEYKSKSVLATIYVFVRKLDNTDVPVANKPINVPEIDLNSTFDALFNDVLLGPLVVGEKVCSYSIVEPYSNFPGLTGPLPSATECSTVGAKPYFKAIGDLRAGKSVKGWNLGVSNPKRGASTSGSVTANDDVIKGVASAMYNSQSNILGSFIGPRPLKGLSFSNSDASNYGGQFNSTTVFTKPDAYYDPTAAIAASLIAGNVIPETSTTQAYSSPGDLVLVSSSIPGGQRTTLYVDGNVTIKGNITYANAGGYASLSSIPSLRIIATGNIFIDPNVTQLDGTFIAGGYLYTCNDGSWGAPIPSSGFLKSPTNLLGLNLFLACEKPLRVNGSLVAKDLKLIRTPGAMRASQDNDGKLDPDPATPGLQNQNTIAEAIVNSVESYLARPAGAPYSYAGTRVDAVTTLPPLY